MQAPKLTSEQVDSYHRDGYVIVKNFISSSEISRLYAVATEDELLRKHAFDLNDQSGKKTKLTLWYVPGNDVYGLLTRSRRMVNAVDQLIDGDADGCHLHYKPTEKEPTVGGAWEGLQEYC